MFTETENFTKRAEKLFTEEEIVALMVHLMNSPTAGDVIPASQGLRKIRWAAKGHGKSGGARVIYFYQVSPASILLLDVYSKNDKTDLTKEELKRLTKLANL